MAPLLKAYQEEVDRVTARWVACWLRVTRCLLSLASMTSHASLPAAWLLGQTTHDRRQCSCFARLPPNQVVSPPWPLSHPLCSAKAAESAFLGLYKRLYEAPDPAPALAQGLEAASRAAQLEAEAAKMGQVRGQGHGMAVPSLSCGLEDTAALHSGVDRSQGGQHWPFMIDASPRCC